MATSHPEPVFGNPHMEAGRPEPAAIPRREPLAGERKRDEPPAYKPDQVDPPANREPGEPAAPGDPDTIPPDPDDPMRSGT